MRHKNYRLDNQLHALNQMKERGIKSVVWKLTEEQIALFGKYYAIEPYLYYIKTKKLNRIHDVSSSLLKEIHYGNKRGKNIMVRPLSDEQKRLLDSGDVSYRPYKYRIVLTDN